jgi:hypothetical protein
MTRKNALSGTPLPNNRTEFDAYEHRFYRLRKDGPRFCRLYAYGIAGIAVAVVAAAVIPLEFTDASPGPSVLGNAERPTTSIWTRNLILSAISFGLVGFSFFLYSALYASYAHTALGFSVIDSGACPHAGMSAGEH